MNPGEPPCQATRIVLFTTLMVALAAGWAACVPARVRGSGDVVAP
jgi:hypothetical protein